MTRPDIQISVRMVRAGEATIKAHRSDDDHILAWRVYEAMRKVRQDEIAEMHRDRDNLYLATAGEME